MGGVYGYANPDMHAAHLAHLPVATARLELKRVLNEPALLQDRNLQQWVDALDWNARLVTRLRERDIRIWG